MHATVHLADHGVAATRRWRAAVPRSSATPGVLWSRVFTPAPLATVLPRPQFGRHGLVVFWSDTAAADRFLGGADLLTAGWFVRLDPVRAVGSWPGLPPDLPTSPAITHVGPSVVLTLGRLRLTQAVRFFRASAKAEKHIMRSPGLTWATGLAAPPRFVATVSVWHDPTEMDAAVRREGHHLDAVRQQNEKDFHHESAFIRFSLVAAHGSLHGRNGLPDLASTN